jgi:hypothetical protein
MGERIIGLYMDWKNGDITREQHHNMKERFEKKEKELQETVRRVKDEMSAIGQGISSEDSYLQAFLRQGNVRELSQGLLVELIEAVYIHEGGGLTIRFKIADPYRDFRCGRCRE